MATVVPTEGINWFRDSSVNAIPADERLFEVGVGDGTTAASSSDTQLDNELYRGGDDDSSVDISAQSANGEIEAKITVNGGTEVPADSDLTEFGIWAIDPANSTTPFSNGSDITDSEDSMVYREVRQAVTIESGDTQTLSVTFNITEA